MHAVRSAADVLRLSRMLQVGECMVRACSQPYAHVLALAQRLLGLLNQQSAKQTSKQGSRQAGRHRCRVLVSKGPLHPALCLTGPCSFLSPVAQAPPSHPPSPSIGSSYEVSSMGSSSGGGVAGLGPVPGAGEGVAAPPGPPGPTPPGPAPGRPPGLGGRIGGVTRPPAAQYIQSWWGW